MNKPNKPKVPSFKDKGTLDTNASKVVKQQTPTLLSPKSSLMDQFIMNPQPLERDAYIINFIVDERYNRWAIFSNGRVFMQRAKGTSGGYDTWREMNTVGEIKRDLKI